MKISNPQLLKPVIPALCMVALSISAAPAQIDSMGITRLGNYPDYATLPRKDVYGYTDLQGREYALLGIFAGVSILDVTDPRNITEVAFITSPQSVSKDIKTFQHYAYIVSDPEGTGMQIVDLSDLPNSASVISTYTGNQFQASHNLWIDTTRALMYATGQGGFDCRILSLEDPEIPSQIGFINIENHDMYGAGDLLYIPQGVSNAVSIFNVAQPESPRLLKQIPFPTNNATYVHTVRTTIDEKYMITSEEVAGKTVKLWDIQNYDSARVIDEYMADNDSSAIAHDVYFKGSMAYMSYYTRGIRIFDLTYPISLNETAWYHETGDNVWGIYVFPSGKILASDALNGLVVYELLDKTLLDPLGRVHGPMFNQLPQLRTGAAGRFEFFLTARGNFKVDLMSLTGERRFSFLGRGFEIGHWHQLTSLNLYPGAYIWQLVQSNGSNTGRIFISE